MNKNKTTTNDVSDTWVEREESSGKTLTPEEFGEFLRKERESRFITYQDISKATRIRAHLLETLERGDFANLPPPPFIRGFVRSIAKFMDMDLEDVMSRFDRLAGEFFEEKSPDILEKKKVEKNIPWFYILMGSIAILVVSTVILFLRSSNQKESEITYKAIENIPTQERKTNFPVSHVELKPSPPPAIETEKIKIKDKDKKEKNERLLAPPTPKVEKIENVEKKKNKVIKKKTETEKVALSLTIKAKEVCWVYLHIDDEKDYDVILKEGETKTWTGDRKFELTLGNSGGVDISLNGKTLGPYGKSGEVARGILISKKDLR